MTNDHRPTPPPAPRVLAIEVEFEAHRYLVRFRAGQGSAAIGAVQRWAKNPQVPLTWPQASHLCSCVALAQYREFLRLVQEQT